MHETTLEESRPDTVHPYAIQAYGEGMKKMPYVLSGLGYSSLRPGQDKAVRSIMMGRDSVVILPTSTGKCFAAGTPILMRDGSVKLVEDIREKDIVMGGDSGPRVVSELIRGRDDMFEIRPTRKSHDSHVVNADHTLSLVITPRGSKKDLIKVNGVYYEGGQIIDITVREYLAQTTTFKRRAKLYKVGVEFEIKQLLTKDLPPYILGVWLGDGSVSATSVNNPNKEVIEELRLYAKTIGAKFGATYIRGDLTNAHRSITFPHDRSGRRGGSNIMINALRAAGVWNDKHIPKNYLLSSRADRLELIAGIIDADGDLSSDGSAYSVTFKQRQMSEELMFLAKSLGLYSTIAEKSVKLKGWTESRIYHRVYISGQIEIVPCRIARKKANKTIGRVNKMRVGFSVIHRGVGDYYGFSILGQEKRFLLGDFTVTHNSGCFIIPALCMGWKTIVIYPLIALMRDQASGMQRNGLSAACISSNETDAHNAAVIRDWATGNLQFMLVSPERFANANWSEVVTQFPPDFVAMDECLTGDVEILTSDGFVRFDELKDGTYCAQVNPHTKELSYVIPSKFIRRKHVGDMIRIQSHKGVDLDVTPSHDLLRYRDDGSWSKVKASAAKFNHTWRFLGAPTQKAGRDALTPDERLQVAYQADGHRHSKTVASFSFSKERKIIRFMKLMQDGGFEWTESNDNDPLNRRRFLVRKTAHLSKTMRGTIDLSKLSTIGCRALVEDAVTWDGSDISDRLCYYSCTDESNTDFFQEACVLAGMRSRKTKQVDTRKSSYKDVHRLFIRRGEPWIDTQNFTSEVVDFSGMVYCVEVPDGCIVVRRSGKPVVIGNCHTLAEWQDTFRPGYKFAGDFIKKVRPKVVAAFSATLSEEAEQEARAGLGITGAKLIYHYPRRTNLHLQTMQVDNIRDAFPWVAQECKGSTIVYASTRSRVESYADSLSRFTKRPVYYYHGGMKPADKKYQQDKFMADQDSIIVATNAFGMGIDKGSIRHVVHFDIPGTLVAYSQELGRAGRDGLDSTCTIIPTPEGIRTRRHFIRCGNPTEHDIKDFVKAAAGMRSGRDGVINAKRDDIARKAGLDVMTIQSIMAFCLGEGILLHDGDAAKKMRIKFMPDVPSFTKVEAEMRDAIVDIGVDADKDGWLHLDIRALAEQVGREPATVTSRLRVMNESGKIEWVKSSTSKPLRLGIDIESVDPEAFGRLNAKAAEANNALKQVLELCDTADEDKHSFLESYLNR